MPAGAQPATPPAAVVGVLCVGDCPAPPLDVSLPAFLDTLRAAGYVDGQNLVVDVRGVGDTREQLPMLARRLINRKVDVIVAMGAGAVLAAKEASTTIPIVMLDVPNALELGLVASLARPGRNVTGVTFPLAELSAKQMELLKQLTPGPAWAGVLWNPATPYAALARKHAEAAGRSVGLRVRSIEIHGAGDLDRVRAAIGRDRRGALLVVEDLPLSRVRNAVTAFALEERLPVMAWTRQYPLGGGLFSYGPSRVEMHRLAATMVGKILKGRRPADIPVEQPTRYELVVNLATAKTIGVTIPPAVLAAADEVVR
jgi:putative ABC transport system substrate-binding protein